jgi:putative membrane protein
VAAVATLADLVVVWGWHAPALHAASRGSGAVMAAEQASFAAVALLLWLPALAGPPLAGALALFMTAMHMTLLGVLIGLAPRMVHAAQAGVCGDVTALGLTALQDQQLGGVIMLTVAGAVYGAAALWLASRALRLGGAA